MSGGDVVAVFCDEANERELKVKFEQLANFSYEFFSVRNGPSMYRAVRLLCASKAHYRCALNLCTGTAEDEHHASAAVLASLFEDSGVFYAGCRHVTLKQPLDVLFMMCFYAGIPLPRFAVVTPSTDLEQLDLRFPVKVKNANPLQKTFESVVQEAAIFKKVLDEVFQSHDKIVVWEVSPAREEEVQLLVSGTGCIAVTQEGAHKDFLLVEQWTSAAKEYGSAFAKYVINNMGFAKLRFNRRTRFDMLVLEGVELGCSLLELNNELFLAAAAAGLLEGCIREVERNCRPPVVEVQLAGSGKGYILCASRHIKRGELVFEDEGRSLVVVTRPFVEKRWGPAEKRLFAEYAWPLDSEGHVYAIWESDPSKWRPINHSCDPNCIFDEGHSLNVIASRDVKMGEELTMDYATFCDYTMKPFQCFCGSKDCRKIILPDEASLQKYGSHSWHRRPPVPPVNDG